MKSLIQTIVFVVAVLKGLNGAEVVMYAQVGEPITLSPTRTPTGLYIYWYYHDVNGPLLAWINPMGGQDRNKEDPWKDKLSLYGDSLRINGVQENHFDTFFCVMKKTKSQVEHTDTYKVIKLDVGVSPSLPLLPGSKATLTCKVDHQGLEKPILEVITPKGQKERVINGKVEITVEAEHSGTWACVVKNDKGEQRKNVEVPVKVVGFSPAPKRLYTSTSSPLTIPCSVPSDIPWEQIKPLIRDVHWHFIPKGSTSLGQQMLLSLSPKKSSDWIPHQNRGLSADEGNAQGNFSISRNKGREDDIGEYKCSMTFDNEKTLSSTIQVDVLQIIPSPGTEVVSGKQLNVSCTTGEPLPDNMRLKIVPPRTLSPSNTDSSLRIPKVGEEAGGKWKCELWQNKALLTSAVTTLKIEPLLSVWMLVIICSAAVILLLLCVLTFILCRRRQKRRYLRHQLCRCKNPKPRGFYRT
ncbi:CD4-1 molecule [Menidia menidia]